MTAQELLEALEKARNESNLDQVAFRAVSRYLDRIWKNSLSRDLRAYDLGKALSDFFVDLSMHRLPENITNQTPQTEQHLMEFFGVAKGGLPQFWTRCNEIWDATFKHYPAYGGEVKRYFDLLLQSSLQGRPSDFTISPNKPPVESFDNSLLSSAQAHFAGGPASEATTGPLILSEPNGDESQVEPTAPVASKPMDEPPQADVLVSDGNQAGLGAPSMESIPNPEPEPLSRNAYLVLQGTKVIPLNRPFIKVGRQLDNDLILEDPRVSRSHAEIRLVYDRFMIFDMNSTGGTFVNGRPTNHSVLYPGDEVSLAGVVFVYSEEMPSRPGVIKIHELGNPFAVDRSTAVIHEDEMWAPEKIQPKELSDLPKTGPFE